MGTASTMNALAEALGMSLPGCAAIPAPYRERGQMAYETGLRIVEMVWEDLRPSDIMTREAFENAIVANCGDRRLDQRADPYQRHRASISACRSTTTTGSASASRSRCSSTCSRPANISARNIIAPAACRRCMHELIGAGKIHESALTCNGKTIGENCKRQAHLDREVIRSYDKPLKEQGGLPECSRATLFDSAIMKTSVISEEFQERYLTNPKDPNAFEGRVVVFDGPEDYHHRIDDPALEDRRAHDPDHARRRARSAIRARPRS